MPIVRILEYQRAGDDDVLQSQCRRANPIFPKFTRLEPRNAGLAGRDQPGFSLASGARTQKSDHQDAGKDRAECSGD